MTLANVGVTEAPWKWLINCNYEITSLLLLKLRSSPCVFPTLLVFLALMFSEKKMKIKKKTKAETIKNIVSHSTFQDFWKKGLRHWIEQKEKTMVSENDQALKIITIWLVFVYKLMIKKWYFIFPASSKIRDGASSDFPEQSFKWRQLRVSNVFFLLGA